MCMIMIYRRREHDDDGSGDCAWVKPKFIYKISKILCITVTLDV